MTMKIHKDLINQVIYASVQAACLGKGPAVEDASAGVRLLNLMDGVKEAPKKKMENKKIELSSADQAEIARMTGNYLYDPDEGIPMLTVGDEEDTFISDVEEVDEYHLGMSETDARHERARRFHNDLSQLRLVTVGRGTDPKWTPVIDCPWIVHEAYLTFLRNKLGTRKSFVQSVLGKKEGAWFLQQMEALENLARLLTKSDGPSKEATKARRTLKRFERLLGSLEMDQYRPTWDFILGKPTQLEEAPKTLIEGKPGKAYLQEAGVVGMQPGETVEEYQVRKSLEEQGKVDALGDGRMDHEKDDFTNKYGFQWVEGKSVYKGFNIKGVCVVTKTYDPDITKPVSKPVFTWVEVQKYIFFEYGRKTWKKKVLNLQDLHVCTGSLPNTEYKNFDKQAHCLPEDLTKSQKQLLEYAEKRAPGGDLENFLWNLHGQERMILSLPLEEQPRAREDWAALLKIIMQMIKRQQLLDQYRQAMGQRNISLIKEGWNGNKYVYYMYFPGRDITLFSVMPRKDMSRELLAEQEMRDRSYKLREAFYSKDIPLL